MRIDAIDCATETDDEINVRIEVGPWERLLNKLVLPKYLLIYELREGGVLKKQKALAFRFAWLAKLYASGFAIMIDVHVNDRADRGHRNQGWWNEYVMVVPITAIEPVPVETAAERC